MAYRPFWGNSLRPVTVGSGRVGQILLLSFTFPLGVPPDLQSGVKKCPNLFRLCGFVIRSKGVCFPFCWGITNPPVLIGRTFFTADFKSAGTPDGVWGKGVWGLLAKAQLFNICSVRCFDSTFACLPVVCWEKIISLQRIVSSLVL